MEGAERDLVEFRGRFEFEGLQFRKLRNGNKIRIVLEMEFDEQYMADLARLVDRRVEVDIVETRAPKEVDPDEVNQLRMFEGEGGDGEPVEGVEEETEGEPIGEAVGEFAESEPGDGVAPETGEGAPAEGIF